jgi:UDP-glucose 4-epimerase
MGYIRDMVEIESFCRGFRREAQDLILTILRFAHIIGPTADTPMNSYLRQPWSPSLLGFDPMMQLIHENDVVAALVHASYSDAPGLFNVGAEDPMPLNKVRGLAQKPPIAVFHPLLYWSMDLLGRRAFRDSDYPPIDPDYVRYPCVGDLTRMRQDLDFRPHYTAEDALRGLAEHKRLSAQMPESTILAQSAERLGDIIEQRERAREHRVRSGSRAGEGEEDGR